VKAGVAAMLVLAAAKVLASTAYVSDELVLGVYADQNNQGQRLATLHSGASVETLAVSGEFTQVRLSDGTTTGWVKSAYLTTQEPATLRVKQLEEELDRSRATTPALAEAAARSEVLQLKRELSAKQSELDARPLAAAAGGAVPGGVLPDGAAGMAPRGAMAGIAAATALHPWVWAASIAAALAGGFWLGYATLARRIKHKFGGIRVY
jgi:hypothetical protein